MNRPHKFPINAPGILDAEVIAWKCAACGEWVNDSGERTECPIDWRRRMNDPIRRVCGRFPI